MICVADQDIITLEQLDELCRALIEEIQADIDAYEERAALQVRDDGKTTTQRAIESLQRPERFPGEHEVAKAWLRTNEPHVRIFWRSNE
jgi:hypothetical protein